MPNIYPKSKLAKPSISAAMPAVTTISRAELAALLDKSQDTVDRLHDRGQGPARFKIGREWRYRVVDVEAWLADRVRTEAHRSNRLRKLIAAKPDKRTAETASANNEATT
jgi:predicted DNA-binding transcriptional regulator AlpA